MASVYLNAYLTEDRVERVVHPLLQAASGRDVAVSKTEFVIGTSSVLRLNGVEFSRTDTSGGVVSRVKEAAFDRAAIKFRPFTLLSSLFRVDSVIVEGLRGSVSIGEPVWTGSLSWSGTYEDAVFNITLGNKDIQNTLIKNILISGSDFCILDMEGNTRLHFDDFTYSAVLESFRAVYMVLMRGEIKATLSDHSAYSRPPVDLILSGRLQINLDDMSFVIREGMISIDGNRYSFTALPRESNGNLMINLFFNDLEENVMTDILKLPPPVGEWLTIGEKGRRYQIKLFFADSDERDQT